MICPSKSLFRPWFIFSGVYSWYVMKLAERKKLKADIASQIDLDFVAEKEKDPRAFHDFLKKGQEVMKLGRVLKEV